MHQEGVTFSICFRKKGLTKKGVPDLEETMVHNIKNAGVNKSSKSLRISTNFVCIYP